ncbi:restriction endonuclease subunit S [Salinicoccus luteus]|uniref:restriction endonuclease subunit S n=1 Tax=Salinicoccus luteus TaxID=367840 RepID=UPI0009FC5969|nr:restriction endonuclease subunit S [Salinicoccus luteus]
MTNEIKKVKLGELCEITSSKRIYMRDYVKEGIPFYRSKEIIEKFKHKTVTSPLYISEEKFSEIEQKFGSPEPEDILLTSVGTIGVPYFIKRGEKFYFKDGNLTWFRNFKETTTSKYIYYWLQSPEGKKEINQQIIGSTQKALTISSIKEMQVSLPSLNIQGLVVKILDNINSKLEINNKMNKTLEETAMLLYKHWFVDFGSFQDEEFVDSEIGLIPEGWEIKSLKELYNFSSGGTPSRKKEEYYKEGSFNWVKTKELKDSFIFKTEEKITEEAIENSSAKLLPKGTVLLAMYGATVSQLGILGSDSTTNQACCALDSKGELTNSLAYLYLKYNRTWIKSLANGGAQQNINQQMVKGLKVAVPINKNSLSDLLKRIENIFALIEANQREIDKLAETRDYLLPKLLSGEIDLSDAEQRVEEATK